LTVAAVRDQIFADEARPREGETMRRMKLVFAVLVALAPSLAASAAVTVFQDPTNFGTPAPPATINVGSGAVPLNVFYQTGSTPSASGHACLDGVGDEVCGWDIYISTSSPSIVLQSFTPDTGAGSDIVWNISGNVLRANGGNPINGELGPHRIGTLLVNASAAGSVNVSGNLYVTAALGAANVVPAPTAIANVVAGADSDGDGVPDTTDNCPTVPNGVTQAGVAGVGNQTDTDGDLVGDACDNCVFIPNPRVNLALITDCTNAGLCWATMTGGQRDDDHDGYGNKCDGDFTPAGTNVGTLDIAQFNASNGKSRLTDLCGTAGNRPCAIFDLDEGTALNIGTPDKAVLNSLLGLPAGGHNPAGSGKCPTCPLTCVTGVNGTCN
jgi:hypothetical protein